MITALNMTMPIKQDAATQQTLQAFKANFATQAQPAIDAALRKSGTVHFARVLIIDDRYIQVITEFDGDTEVYTEFFRQELPAVFQAIFSLVEGAPAWDDLNNPNSFFQYASTQNLKALGTSDDGDPRVGYLFKALGDLSVMEIKALQGQSSQDQPSQGQAAS